MAKAPPKTNVLDRSANHNPVMSDDKSGTFNQQKRDANKISATGDDPAPAPIGPIATAIPKMNRNLKPSNESRSRSPKVDNRNPDNVTTQKVEGKSKSWWERQNITLIKEQAQLRGRKFDDTETKGANKFKKQDYLNELYKLL